MTHTSVWPPTIIHCHRLSWAINQKQAAGLQHREKVMLCIRDAIFTLQEPGSRDSSKHHASLLGRRLDYQPLFREMSPHSPPDEGGYSGPEWAAEIEPTISVKTNEKFESPLPPFQWWKKKRVLVCARIHHWYGGRGVLFLILFCPRLSEVLTDVTKRCIGTK